MRGLPCTTLVLKGNGCCMSCTYCYHRISGDDKSKKVLIPHSSETRREEQMTELIKAVNQVRRG